MEKSTLIILIIVIMIIIVGAIFGAVYAMTMTGPRRRNAVSQLTIYEPAPTGATGSTSTTGITNTTKPVPSTQVLVAGKSASGLMAISGRIDNARLRHACGSRDVRPPSWI